MDGRPERSAGTAEWSDKCAISWRSEGLIIGNVSIRLPLTNPGNDAK